MASNGSKPFQAALIRAAGFDTPRTLIAADKAAVLAFQARHGPIVYKSISGVRSIVARLTEAQISRLDEPAACPTQFQEQIAGTDLRVHVIGDEVYGCEILSTADDYRYARARETLPSLRPWTPPEALADRCRSLVSALGLEAAGIDLRRRDDGRWCCFEVNPSPGFTWYEQATGAPIADAVARRLIDP
jgi:glutathione synthase/RimK-type ligase-like ATP-grasp enzyme